MIATVKSSPEPAPRSGRHRPHRLLFTFLALMIALPLAALPGPVAGQESAGCGCDTTGEYKSPKGLVSVKDVELLPPSATEGTSPKGTYEVSVAGTHPGLTLTVRRSSDDTVLLSLFTRAVEWGFSPDETRFLIIRHDNGVTSWQLYDLTATNPEDPLLMPEPSSLATSGRLGFSPKGNYLAFVSLVESRMANIQIWETTTGDRWESGNFSFISGTPGEGKSGETYNGVTFGFGPDGRSFAYAYAANSTFAQLNLRNLATGQYVVDTSYNSGFWQFSPCGDVFAMVQQMDQVGLDVRLVSTASGDLLNGGSTGFPFGAVEFETTETAHTMTLTTPSDPTPTTYELVPNTTGEDCEEPPTGDTTAPTWPGDASITSGTVTETSVALSWSEAQDDTAVTGYTLSVYRGGGSGDSNDSGSICLYCASTGTSGSGSSGGGQSVWISAPQPGSGGSSGDSLTLVGTLETTDRSATITGLKSGTEYTFTVEAVDGAGNESDGGPSVTVTTTAIPVGEISGTVWFDSNGNGERDSIESPFVFPQMIAWQLTETDVEGQFTIGGWPHSQSLSDGRYFFRDLPPGTYLIMKQGNWLQSDPAGFAPHVVTLDANQGVRGVDFFVTGEAVSETGTASISGTVWDDINGNASLDAGEPGIAGVTVCASHSNFFGTDCEESDENGNYRFDNLPPGLYQVWGDPSMVGNHYPTLPPGELDSHIFTLSDGGSETRNLGYAPGNAAFEGTVWNDENNNGQRDNGEGGLADIEVCQWGPVTSDCTFTDVDGVYEFTGLVPGEYDVEVETSGDLTQTHPADGDDWSFELESGEIRTDIDFGLATSSSSPTAEIRGVVWSDLNLNGQRDDGEPGIAGVEVCYQQFLIALSESSDSSTAGCTETDPAGEYVFANLSPVAYIVSVSEATTHPEFDHFVSLDYGQVAPADFGLKPDGTPANTPAGSDVTVDPLEDGGVTIAFASVTEAGETTVETGDAGPDIPAGFMLGNPPIFYDISTTATFEGSATVCIEYDDAVYGNESALALFHYEDGEWVNVTMSLDPEKNTICGSVELFSPFIVLEADTTSPSLHLPDDITAEGNAADGATVDLPEVTAIDLVDPEPSVSCDATDGFFPLGDTTITCTAEDAMGNKASGSYTVSVVDTTPPTVDAAADVTVVAEEPDGTGADHPDITALLASATANDIVYGTLNVINDAPETFPLGETVVTFTATDASGNTGQTTRTVTVINHPPDCTTATPSIAMLWPANHKLHEVTIKGVTDPDGHPVTIVITAIYQDELVLGTGSGQQAPDGLGVGTSTAEVRAERDAHGDGRVYHISFEASDGIDTCIGEVTVSVPKSRKAEAVDGGALNDSTRATVEEVKTKGSGKKKG